MQGRGALTAHHGALNLALGAMSLVLQSEDEQMTTSAHLQPPSLVAISNFQLATRYCFGAKVFGVRYQMMTTWEGCSH